MVKILRGRGGGRGREIWQVLIRRRMEGNVEHRVSFKNRGREEGDAGLNARDTNIADLLSCGSARDQVVCRPIIVQTSYQPLPFHPAAASPPREKARRDEWKGVGG